MRESPLYGILNLPAFLRSRLAGHADPEAPTALSLKSLINVVQELSLEFLQVSSFLLNLAPEHLLVRDSLKAFFLGLAENGVKVRFYGAVIDEQRVNSTFETAVFEILSGPHQRVTHQRLLVAGGRSHWRRAVLVVVTESTLALGFLKEPLLHVLTKVSLSLRAL